MNHQFREHYTPVPVASDEPHPLLVLAGAAVIVSAVYLITIVLFTL